MLDQVRLKNLQRIAHGIAATFGKGCEVVVHDLCLEHVGESIVLIENGQVTNRKKGDGPSHIVLEALQAGAKKMEDKLAYLTRTKDGRILKSSTIFIRDEEDRTVAILAINFDITTLLGVQHEIEELISVQKADEKEGEPEDIPQNVSDLLEELIEQSIRLVGKPVALMNKEEKTKAVQYLNRAGAFLVTKSGDKVASRFGISKFTLYSYLEAGKERGKSK